jgi:hypothetical protein
MPSGLQLASLSSLMMGSLRRLRAGGGPLCGHAAKMVHQAGVGARSDAPKEDEVKVSFVKGDLEIIPWLDLAAGPYRFGDDDLTALPDARPHQV